MNNQINQETKQPVKNRKSGAFTKFLRVLFVEDWGLKFLALAFAVAVWAIFKAS